MARFTFSASPTVKRLEANVTNCVCIPGGDATVYRYLRIFPWICDVTGRAEAKGYKENALEMVRL